MSDFIKFRWSISTPFISLLENFFGKWDLWICCFGAPLGAYLIFKGRKILGLENKNFNDKG